MFANHPAGPASFSSIGCPFGIKIEFRDFFWKKKNRENRDQIETLQDPILPRGGGGRNGNGNRNYGNATFHLVPGNSFREPYGNSQPWRIIIINESTQYPDGFGQQIGRAHV